MLLIYAFKCEYSTVVNFHKTVHLKCDKEIRKNVTPSTSRKQNIMYRILLLLYEPQMN